MDDGPTDGTGTPRTRPPDNHVHTHWSWDTPDTLDDAAGLRAGGRAGAAGDRVHRAPRLHRLATTTTARPPRAWSTGTRRGRRRHRRRGLLRRARRGAATASPTCASGRASRPGEPHLFGASVADLPARRPRRPGARLAALAAPTAAGWSASPGCCGSDADATMRRYLAELRGHDREQRRLPGARARATSRAATGPGARTGTWRRTSRRSTARCSGRWPAPAARSR